MLIDWDVSSTYLAYANILRPAQLGSTIQGCGRDGYVEGGGVERSALEWQTKRRQ